MKIVSRLFVLFFVLFFPVYTYAQGQKISLCLEEEYTFKQAGVLTALQRGYYQNAGLDVHIDVCKDPKKTLLRVIEKKVDYAFSYTSIPHIDKHKAPVEVGYSFLESTPLVLLSHSSIEGIEQLRGKKIAGKKEYLLYSPVGLMLKQFDVRLKNSTFVFFDSAIGAFIHGDVDAVALDITDPALYTLKRSEKAYHTFYPRTYGFDMTGLNLYTHIGQSDKEKARTKVFVEATMKGWEYAFSHMREVSYLLNMKNPKITQKAFLQEAQKLYSKMKGHTPRVYSEKNKRYEAQLIESKTLIDDTQRSATNYAWKLLYLVLAFAGMVYYLYYEQKMNVERLEKLSTTDKLTQLFNRLKIDELLDTQEKRFIRYGEQCSVVMIDIDYFKSVNDQYGHNVGDEVLKEFANILLRNIRNTDFLGRWGGEEFMVICPNSSVKSARILAEKLRTKVEAHHFKYVGKKTASFGIAEYQKGLRTAEVIEMADSNLYTAKEQGRNRICC